MAQPKPLVRTLGIGGVFFRAKDPAALMKWYTATFGILDPHSGPPWTTEAGVTVFTPFDSKTDYFGKPPQWAMVNFRIADLDEAVANLAKAGVPLVKPIEAMEGIGRFAWINDPEGNRIELWQPA